MVVLVMNVVIFGCGLDWVIEDELGFWLVMVVG